MGGPGNLQKAAAARSPEVWMLAEDTVFPLEWYQPVADAAGKICGPDLVGARSAAVACYQLQKAQIEMYADQARHLPFEIGVFTSRNEAVAWAKAGPCGRL